MTDRIVMLHGRGIPSWTTRWLGAKLGALGYDVSYGRYGRRGLREAAAHVAVHLPPVAEGVRTHFVGHAFGGLVAREVAARSRRGDIGRVVALASPMRGDLLPGSRRAGPVARFLVSPCHPDLDPSARDAYDLAAPWHEVGVVAGVIPGTALVRIPNDGLVPLSATRFAGMADHVTVATSHFGMLVDPRVPRQVEAFLAHGAFVAKATLGDSVPTPSVR